MYGDRAILSTWADLYIFCLELCNFDIDTKRGLGSALGLLSKVEEKVDSYKPNIHNLSPLNGQLDNDDNIYNGNHWMYTPQYGYIPDLRSTQHLPMYASYTCSAPHCMQNVVRFEAYYFR